MVINGVEIEFDVNDVELVEKVEESIKTKFAEMEVKGSYAETIRYFCNQVFDFFDESFGEGTAIKIFGTKVNYKLCNEALIDFRTQYDSEINKNNQEIFKKLDKYSPNRATRRAKK